MDARNRQQRCPVPVDDLVAVLYDEADPAERDRIERHLSSCPACRQEKGSLFDTIRLLDKAGLSPIVVPPLDQEWPALRARLAATGGGARLWRHPLLRAAGLLLVAGASFWLGGAWRSGGGSVAGLWREIAGDGGAERIPVAGTATPLSPEEEAARLRQFARETNGYLNRSRLVLLAFSNAGKEERPEDLGRASASLLREADRAARLARELKDPRLQQLVSSLEGILGEIAQFASSGDDATLAQLRGSVSLSSVLDQLEILAAGAGSRQSERPHA